MTREPFTVPFTADEAAALAAHQANPWFHPLTCNGGMPPLLHRHNKEVILEVTQGGLVCPECGRVQDWAPPSLVKHINEFLPPGER